MPNVHAPLVLSAALCAALPSAAAIAAPSTATSEPATNDPATNDPAADGREGRPLALAIAGPEDDPELAVGLTPGVEASMRQLGLEPDAGAPQGIFIIIGVDDIAPDTYQIEIRLELQGEAEIPPPLTSSCTRCGSAGLLEQIELRLREAIDLLPSPVEPEAEPEPAPIAPRPTLTLDPAPARRLRARGIAGAALLGTGVAAVATGAIFWVKRTANHPSRGDWELRLRPPGVAFMAGGGAAAVAGGVLLGLDLARPRPASRTSAAPLFGGGLAGVTIRHRF